VVKGIGFSLGKCKVDWTEGNTGEMLAITERGLGVGGVHVDTSNGWENTRIFAAGGISIQRYFLTENFL
jgi:hypothetical protein